MDAEGRYLYIADSDSIWGGQGLYVADLEKKTINHVFSEEMLWHLAVSEDGKVFASNGSTLFAFDLEAETNETLIDFGFSPLVIQDLASGRDGKIYMSVDNLNDETGKVVVINPADNSMVTRELDFMPDKITANTKGEIYFSQSLEDRLYRMDNEGNKVMISDAIGLVSDLEANNEDYVFVINEIGYLGVITPEDKVNTILDISDGLVEPEKLALIP